MLFSLRHLNGTLCRNIVSGHLSYYVLVLLVCFAHYVFLEPGIAISRTLQIPRRKFKVNRTSSESIFKTKHEFDFELKQKLDEFRPKMRELVQKAGDVSSLIPSWRTHRDFDQKEMAEHVAQLQMPSMVGRPSFLLHDLGEEKTKMDRDRLARVSDVFRLDEDVYVPPDFDSLLHFTNRFQCTY
jgi:hypothetical protein